MSNSGLVISDLRCEYLDSPLIDEKKPHFSWITRVVDSGATCQVSYQVKVASSEEDLESADSLLWDSGMVSSKSCNGVEYSGVALSSFTDYFWKVTIHDDTEKVTESPAARFETGALEQSEWAAGWITSPDTLTGGPVFRFCFNTPDSVIRARLYLCGLGYQEAYLNGKRLGNSVLDPAQTDYQRRAFYVGYDILNALTADNILSVMLGNGWFNQDEVWGGMSYGRPCLTAILKITDAAGVTTTICSDENWLVTQGPVKRDNVYGGETYDARDEISFFRHDSDLDWRPAVACSSPTEKLQAQNIPPIRRTREIPAIWVKEIATDTYIVDFGQNFSGWCRLRVENAQAGQTVVIRTAEILTDDGRLEPGTTGVKHTRVIQTESYTCKGEAVEIWEPRFTYHGFRFAEVSGLGYPAHLDTLTGIFVHSDVNTNPDNGFSFCEANYLSRIRDAAAWTQLSNLHGIATDCPHREKCGWLGDAHVAAEMSIYNFDMHGFWTKFMEDIRTSAIDGLPTFVAPGKRFIDKASPDWGTAVVQLPWYLYLYYGDVRILNRYYDMMHFWTKHLESISEDYIVKAGLGDWCAPGKVEGLTPIPVVSTAYFYFDCSIMEAVARLLGKDDDSHYYHKLKESVGDAFRREFYLPAENSFGTQSGNAMALYLGLCPEGKEQAVADALAQQVAKAGGHHATGISGSRHLFWALSRYGHGDTALGILKKSDYPSFGHLFGFGATTLWECWGEKWIDEKEGDRSLNHPMQGGFDAWFWNGIAGLNPDPLQPGFSHLIFQPQIIRQLGDFCARYHSVNGVVKVECHNDTKQTVYELSVPFNMTFAAVFPDNLTVKLSDSSRGQLSGWNNGDVLQCGNYRFEIAFS